jgi:hypothetical protein
LISPPGFAWPVRHCIAHCGLGESVQKPLVNGSELWDDDLDERHCSQDQGGHRRVSLGLGFADISGIVWDRFLLAASSECVRCCRYRRGGFSICAANVLTSAYEF